MRYQAQNLGKKLCSLGKVRVYQCFVFRSLGLVLKLEWCNENFQSSYARMNTSKLFVQKLITHWIQVRGLWTIQVHFYLFSFCVLALFVYRKKVLESNNEQAANTKIKLHSTSNNFLNALSNVLSSAKLGKKLYSLGKVRIYQCFFSIFGFGECPDVAIDWL